MCFFNSILWQIVQAPTFKKVLTVHISKN
jgi:hypothetical protein